MKGSRFVKALGEACDKTGWRIHAFTLMGSGRNIWFTSECERISRQGGSSNLPLS